jgi:hypothetical protein
LPTLLFIRLLFAKIADQLRIAVAVDEISMASDNVPLSGNDPMDWSKTAQSITEKNTQERQTNTDNAEQQQQTVAAAVDLCLLDQLVRLGFSRSLAQDLLRQFGADRVRAVLDRSQDTGIHNPAGFVRRALLEDWAVTPQRVELRSDDPMRYVRGKFGDLIQH